MHHSALFLLDMMFDYTQDSFAFAGIPRYPVSRVGTRFAVSLVTTPSLLQSNDELFYSITHKFVIFSEYFVLIKIFQSVIQRRQRKLKTSVGG